MSDAHRSKPTRRPASSKEARFVNPSRVRLATEMRAFAADTAAGELVLDAGAGRGPYRHLFKHARYESADFAQLDSTEYVPLDYVCDLTNIPVADGRFDAVFCNQVLEHLPEPHAALCELRRVLRPGGRMLLTAPLFYQEHQVPYDFFRYTQFGLRHLLEGAGFVVDELRWLEGYFGTLAYQFDQMHRCLPTDSEVIRQRAGGGASGLSAALTIQFTKAFAAYAQRFFAQLDATWNLTDRGLPKNYLVLAHRPDDA